MAQKIFLSEQQLNQVLEKARKELSKKRFESKVTYSFEPAKTSERASLIFTEIAFAKQRALIDHFSTEIEWHGLVERLDTNKYLVKDILVFPHEVTATTVISDPVEYQKFFSKLTDKQQQEFRLHGHSHVNMGVTPSAVDNKYREDTIKNIGLPRKGTDEDLFYIFLIGNKRGEYSYKIYDLTNGNLYETDEVDRDVAIGEDSLVEFLLHAKSLVTTPADRAKKQAEIHQKQFQSDYKGTTQLQIVAPKTKPNPPQKAESQSHIGFYDEYEDDDFGYYGHGVNCYDPEEEAYYRCQFGTHMGGKY